MNRKVLKDFSPEAKSLQPNTTYEHYKGMQYKVLGIARHSETLEELVVYQALYGEKGIWVRPVTMFLEKMVINSELTPRFKKVEQ
jgi:hypothetical protein